MSRLFFLILTISVGTCAGVAVIAALTLGYYALGPIMISAAIGAVAGVLAAFFVARQLEQREREH